MSVQRGPRYVTNKACISVYVVSTLSNSLQFLIDLINLQKCTWSNNRLISCWKGLVFPASLRTSKISSWADGRLCIVYPYCYTPQSRENKDAQHCSFIQRCRDDNSSCRSSCLVFNGICLEEMSRKSSEWWGEQNSPYKMEEAQYICKETWPISSISFIVNRHHVVKCDVRLNKSWMNKERKNGHAGRRELWNNPKA